MVCVSSVGGGTLLSLPTTMVLPWGIGWLEGAEPRVLYPKQVNGLAGSRPAGYPFGCENPADFNGLWPVSAPSVQFVGINEGDRPAAGAHISAIGTIGELFEFVTFSSRGFTTLLLHSRASLVWYYGGNTDAILVLLMSRPL
jgi:hypothetical protein